VHYPAFVGFFGEFDSQVSLEFLQEFPTQHQMQALTPRRLRTWLRRHGYGHAGRLEAMEEALRRPALPVPEHVQKVKALLIGYLSRSLIALKAEIAQREKEITERLDELPEADWVCSLPGAGPTLAPCILACVGRDPDRFASADDARALMGTAPVTKASGKSRVVHFRHGCWKFARRTMQLFADQSRHQSAWAQAFYEWCRARGQGHHAALRALAHKWLKIILAMKRKGTRYDESLFANSQSRYLLKAQDGNA